MALAIRYWQEAYEQFAHFGILTRVSAATPDSVLAAIGGEIKGSWQGDRVGSSFALQLDDAQMLFTWDKRFAGTDYNVYLAATSRERITELRTKLLELIPELEPPSTDVIPVRFWALGHMGPVSRERYISAPAWREIAENYPLKTRTALASLVEVHPPIVGGQLVLFRGKPGTGKTYLIRALAREWYRWCSMSYIVDPDKFFGEAIYMLTVLLDLESSVSGAEAPSSSGSIQPKKIERAPEHERWHLLIVEDADELLSVDAKARVGQAFSRLLNLVEGMIGQGMRILVLMTTNETDSRIHPAIKREGRCLFSANFEEFSTKEAVTWLTGRGVKHQGNGLATLADLYAAVRQQREPDGQLG